MADIKVPEIPVGDSAEQAAKESTYVMVTDVLAPAAFSTVLVKFKGDDTAFDGERAISRNVLGLLGVTPGGATVRQFLENVFFPSIAPTATLTGGGIREFGASPITALNWTATKNTNPITGIIVDGVTMAPTGLTQTGLQSAVAQQNVNTTFTMSVTDGTNTAQANTVVQWMNKMYWGHTLSNDEADLNSAAIIALDGAGVGTGSELREDFLRTFNGIDGAGEYLVFAFPASLGTPQFKVNGLTNTAFTTFQKNFTNQQGFTTLYQIWWSATQYNSPVSQLELI